MPKAPRTIAELRPRRRQRPKPRRRKKEKTRQERGYDAAWYRFRAAALANPEDFGLPETFMYCADCQREGRWTRTVDVHHKIPLAVRPDLKYEPSNLEGLCKPHHGRHRWD